MVCDIYNRLSVLTYVWHSVLLALLLRSPTVYAQVRNVTIPVDSSDIVYTPFLCNSSTVTNTPQICEGAWKVLDLNGATIASTSGPAPEASNVIPQFFLRFHAQAFYLTTSTLSNATANITISSNTTTLSSIFNATVGSVLIENIPEAFESTVAITYVPSSDQATVHDRLDIGNLILTVTDNSTTSSIFPTQSLPSASPLPSITISIPPLPPPTSSPTQASSSSHSRLVVLSVSIVLGLGLGLTALVILGYLLWRRHKRRQTDIELPMHREPRLSFQPPKVRRKKRWF